jgi:hypothetical protein
MNHSNTRHLRTSAHSRSGSPHAATFEHGDWGTGNVGGATRRLAHEFTHHQIDVAARATWQRRLISSGDAPSSRTGRCAAPPASQETVVDYPVFAAT